MYEHDVLTREEYKKGREEAEKVSHRHVERHPVQKMATQGRDTINYEK